MAKIKVYGGMMMKDGAQRRVAVATTSWKKAAEIARMPLSGMRDYWSVTGNAKEIELAMGAPETLVFTGSLY